MPYEPAFFKPFSSDHTLLGCYHYLNLADELAGVEPQALYREAKLRTAVSRAYYAAFCKARNRLRDIDQVILTGTGQDHQLVPDEFIRSQDTHRRAIGLNLKRLRMNRNQADYDDVVPGSLPGMVGISMRLALTISEDLRKL